ncbi:MAG: hypothetical protein R3C56_35860 [Pirellulaceae bacterium]
MPRVGGYLIRLLENEEGVQIGAADAERAFPPRSNLAFRSLFYHASPWHWDGTSGERKIVRQHGGNIDFTSNSTGTVFSISLPWEAAEWTAS